MERCDLYDAAGHRLGRTVPRGTPVTPGQEFYLVVHVWIRDETGAYLIQQRALDLPDWPGVWAVTAGYAITEEDSRTAALRETHEEMGLTLPPDSLRLWRRLPYEHRLEEIWLAAVSQASLGPPAPGPEVAAYQWATKSELYQRVEYGGFFKYSYFNDLPA